MQWEVAKKLRELKGEKPKDIYELRDLLERLFPKSDIRLLFKELIEKGYIYWNGHEVLYSHEIVLVKSLESRYEESFLLDIENLHKSEKESISKYLSQYQSRVFGICEITRKFNLRWFG